MDAKEYIIPVIFFFIQTFTQTFTKNLESSPLIRSRKSLFFNVLRYTFTGNPTQRNCAARALNKFSRRNVSTFTYKVLLVSKDKNSLSTKYFSTEAVGLEKDLTGFL